MKVKNMCFSRALFLTVFHCRSLRRIIVFFDCYCLLFLRLVLCVFFACLPRPLRFSNFFLNVYSLFFCVFLSLFFLLSMFFSFLNFYVSLFFYFFSILSFSFCFVLLSFSLFFLSHAFSLHVSSFRCSYISSGRCFS